MKAAQIVVCLRGPWTHRICGRPACGTKPGRCPVASYWPPRREPCELTGRGERMDGLRHGDELLTRNDMKEISRTLSARTRRPHVRSGRVIRLPVSLRPSSEVSSELLCEPAAAARSGPAHARRVRATAGGRVNASAPERGDHRRHADRRQCLPARPYAMRPRCSPHKFVGVVRRRRGFGNHR